MRAAQVRNRGVWGHAPQEKFEKWALYIMVQVRLNIREELKTKAMHKMCDVSDSSCFISRILRTMCFELAAAAS